MGCNVRLFPAVLKKKLPRAGDNGIYEFVDPDLPVEVFPRKHIGGGGEPLVGDHGEKLTKRMGNLTTIHGARRTGEWYCGRDGRSEYRPTYVTSDAITRMNERIKKKLTFSFRKYSARRNARESPRVGSREESVGAARSRGTTD